MTHLVVTADAETDVKEILDYLEREASLRVAADFGSRFRSAIERFVDLPEIGPLRPALGRNVRISIVFPYVLIYEHGREGDTVTSRATQYHAPDS